MADRLEMSQADYARHRGVSRQAIHKLIAAGKIELVAAADGSGEMVIDVVAADRALGETQLRINTPADDEAAAAAPSGGAKLTEARTETETYRARLAQIEYEEKIGQLLRRDDVERSMRLLGDALARGLDAIAGAAIDLAAAFRQGEEAGLRTALKQMVRREQAALTENLAALGAATTAGAGS